MIAIDLIDLTDPLLKDRNQSLRFISHPEDTPQKDFWHLWAAKEAAFKCRRSKEPFQPKSFNIRFDTENTFFWEGLKGKIYQSPKWIISILSDREAEYVLFDTETDNPSKEIREKIKSWFFEKHQIKTGISSDQNDLPILIHNNAPISITHHGRYMAFAYCID